MSEHTFGLVLLAGGVAAVAYVATRPKTAPQVGCNPGETLGTDAWGNPACIPAPVQGTVIPDPTPAPPVYTAPTPGPPPATPPPSSGPAIQQVAPFTGVVDADGVNMRSGPGPSYNWVGSASMGQSFTFDAVAHCGITFADAMTGAADDRFFRIQGTNTWLASAYVNGNPGQAVGPPTGGGGTVYGPPAPSGSPPATAQPPSQQPSPPDRQSHAAQRSNGCWAGEWALHYGGATGGGYWADYTAWYESGSGADPRDTWSGDCCSCPSTTGNVADQPRPDNSTPKWPGGPPGCGVCYRAWPPPNEGVRPGTPQ